VCPYTRGAPGILAGAGGGVSQVVVMGPCTFLVTGAVTGDQSVSTMQRMQRTWAAKGIKGFYPGGTALMFRQATNWASRQVPRQHAHTWDAGGLLWETLNER
jgi:hypothetical protein